MTSRRGCNNQFRLSQDNGEAEGGSRGHLAVYGQNGNPHLGKLLVLPRTEGDWMGGRLQAEASESRNWSGWAVSEEVVVPTLLRVVHLK